MENIIGIATSTGSISIEELYNWFNDLQQPPPQISINNDKNENVVLHNPMMSFWLRAKFYYELYNNLKDKGHDLLFENYALIISDLGQSLYLLFGRHWTKEAKEIYKKKVGTPKQNTPDLLVLLEKCYLPIGWNLSSDNPILWKHLHDFILNYYQNIVKHFEYDKFLEALKIDFIELSKFMEITRQTWVWFIEKVFNIKYDEEDDRFKEFKKNYHSLI